MDIPIQIFNDYYTHYFCFECSKEFLIKSRRLIDNPHLNLICPFCGHQITIGEDKTVEAMRLLEDFRNPSRS